jgi:hypothetical protein
VVLEPVNGNQALQPSAAHQGPIQSLLTDVMASRLSGTAVAEQLALTRLEIRVIYMPGYARERIKRYSIPNGPCLFL